MNMKRRILILMAGIAILVSVVAALTSWVAMSHEDVESRAKLLINTMAEYGGAQQRLRSDASCFSRNLVALFDRSAAVGGANSWCGIDLSKQWNGPYIKTAVKSDTKAILALNQISSSVTVTIGRLSSTYDDSSISTYKWYIVAQNVPTEIASRAITICNGTGEGAGAGNVSAATQHCAINIPGVIGVTPSTAPLQDVYMLFDETRS